MALPTAKTGEILETKKPYEKITATGAIGTSSRIPCPLFGESRGRAFCAKIKDKNPQ